jgi:hypothetical protein
MMFPCDPKRRDEMTTALIEAWLKEEPPSRKIAREKRELQLLRFTPSELLNLRDMLFQYMPPRLLTKSISDDGLNNFGEGLLAGKLLLTLTRLTAVAPEHASLRKAKHLVSIDLIRHGRDLAGQSKSGVNESVRSIAKAWTAFVSVAHLYAAWILVRDEMKRDILAGELERETLLTMLAAAERLRLVGQAHRSKGAPGPLLDRSKMWIVPSHVQLPEVEFQDSRLTKAEREDLAKYAR